MLTDRIRTTLHDGMERGFKPFARTLARAGVTPNHVSFAGAGLTLVSAFLVGHGDLGWGGAIYLIAGCLDTLDGTLARVSDQVSPRGAFIDSTLDRISEGVMCAAVAHYFATVGEPYNAAIAVLGFLAAMLVSYMRARAESLGIACSDGFVTRSERVLALGVGLLFGWIALAIYFVALASAYTAAQRMSLVLRALPLKQDGKREPAS